MRSLRSRLPEYVLLALLVFAILWRGGKSIDATWILAFVASFITLFGKSQIPNPKSQIPIVPWLAGFGFLLWTIVSFLASKTQNYGFDEVLRDGALFLVFVTVARTPAHDLSNRWRRFAMTLVLAATAAVLIGIAVYALQPVNRFVGTFFDARFHTDYWPNAWAEFVLLAWPMALLLALRSHIPWRRVVWIGVLGFLLGSLLLSYSRGAILAFSGQTILLCLVWHFSQTKVPQTRSAAAFALAALIALGIFAGVNRLRASQYDVQSVGDKVTFSATEGTSSINERSAFWKQSLALAQEHPIVGWGPYSFRFVQPRLAEGVLQTSDHPHNVFLKLLMERGVPALLLYLILLLSIFITGVRSLLHLSPERGFVLFGLVAILGVFAHNMIDYNLQFVGIALPLWMMLGLVQAGGVSKKMNATLHTMEKTVAAVLIVVALIEGVFLGMSSLGRRAEARGDVSGALVWYDRATYEVFRRDMDISRANILIKQNAFDQGSIAINDYMKLNAEDSRGWEAKGRLMLLEGKGSDALPQLEKAYVLGKWTGLGILHGVLDACTKTHRALTEEEFTEYYALVKAYGAAIMQNIHFIALSTNVEELGSTTSLLSALCPLSAEDCSRKSEELDLMSVGATLHAGEERSKYRARPSGFLW